MKKRVIAIITDWGPLIGFGHIQRMASLANYINHQPGYHAVIINDKSVPIPDAPPTVPVTPGLPTIVDLIIRDKRDSTVDDISTCGSIAPVIVVDDHGPGRTAADCVIDLLPHPSHQKDRTCFYSELFIYGYTFSQTLESRGLDADANAIDVAFYLGHDPGPEDLAFMSSLLPAKCRGVALAGVRRYLITDNNMIETPEPYATLLLSSRVLVTHFGITLYEGHLAGCRLITINPSSYHSLLADIAAPHLGLTNLGQRAVIDRNAVRVFINEQLGLPNPAKRIPDIQKQCQKNSSRFFEMLVSCMR